MRRLDMRKSLQSPPRQSLLPPLARREENERARRASETSGASVRGGVYDFVRSRGSRGIPPGRGGGGGAERPPLGGVGAETPPGSRGGPPRGPGAEPWRGVK